MLMSSLPTMNFKILVSESLAHTQNTMAFLAPSVSNWAAHRHFVAAAAVLVVAAVVVTVTGGVV